MTITFAVNNVVKNMHQEKISKHNRRIYEVFIDTANIEEIKEGLKLGMVDGVTTNPSLIAKEKKVLTLSLKIY